MENQLTLLVLLSAFYLQAQEFEFPLFFEDAFGEKDTIFLGYDMDATTGIDEFFGEANIKGEPLTGLDVRVVDYADTDIFCSIESNIDYSSFHTKKQIVNSNCEMPSHTALGIIIDKNRFPIKVNWDMNIFPAICYDGPFLTDWHPGGWFDAPCENTQAVIFMSTIDSVIFETTSLGMYTAEGDTVNYLFFNMANRSLDTKEMNPVDNISITPNPTTSSVQILNTAGQFDVFLYNATGKLLLQKKHLYQNMELDLESYADGLYFVKIKIGNQVKTRKIIKN